MSEPALTVHAAWSAFGVPDFSPACLKLKTYLRMSKTPYTPALGDPRKAPTKKIPYIRYEGTVRGDSGLIIEYLKRKVGDPLDARLTAEQHATGHLLRRTCEESLYWPLLYARWADDAVWRDYKREFMAIMPPVLGGFVIGMIRRDALRNAWGQGISRHRVEDVQAHGKADIDTLSTHLGGRPFLFGEEPTSYDATLFGTIANVLAFPPDGALAKHTREKKNLVAFVDRVRERYWATPDAKPT
jgi:glutathione S-transferase